MATLRLEIEIPEADPTLEDPVYVYGELIVDLLIDEMNVGNIPWSYETWSAEWVEETS